MKYLSLILALLPQTVSADPVPLPNVEYRIGWAAAQDGVVTVPVFASVDIPWDVTACLLDLEWTSPLVFVGARPGSAFAAHGLNVHVSANPFLGSMCEAGCLPGNRLRILVVAYGQAGSDLSKPVLWLDFQGQGTIWLTCAPLGELDCNGAFMTFKANATLEEPVSHELWEVAMGYPETGRVTVAGGGVGQISSVGEGDTWSRVKQLYRE